MDLAPVFLAPVPVYTTTTPSAPARPVVLSATAEHQQAGADDLGKYYAAAQGKTGASLLHTLHEIVRTGHVDRGYAQARDELFSEVADTDGDNVVEDIFTGQSRGPITGRKDAYEKGFNTEHTWAQSKGATGIAQSDLHHLQPSNVQTNEKRGSYPYGDVTRVVWSTGEGPEQARLGVDALGATVFEPYAAKKGDIARGLLYFFTRYNESRTDRFTTENFKHELPTLLLWNKLDPVDEKERARNDAVQRVQGNRNPFVDHPEFVDAIGFSSIDIRG